MKKNILTTKRIQIGVLFAWYDLWIGAFWDRKAKTLYLLPIPMLGFTFTFTPTL